MNQPKLYFLFVGLRLAAGNDCPGPAAECDATSGPVMLAIKKTVSKGHMVAESAGSFKVSGTNGSAKYPWNTGDGEYLEVGTRNGKPWYKNSADCSVQWEAGDDWGATNLGSPGPKWTLTCGGHHRYFNINGTQTSPDGHWNITWGSSGTMTVEPQVTTTATTTWPTDDEEKPGWARTPVKLTGRTYHTCAIFRDHSVKCWGLGGHGELGTGKDEILGDDPKDFPLPSIKFPPGRYPIEVAAGAERTCTLLDDGSVECWGMGHLCSLGLGKPDGTYRSTTSTIVNLGTGRRTLSLASGWWHTCALLDNKEVKCWGSNGQGQLGLGDKKDRGCSPDEMGDNLKPLDFGTGRTAVQVVAEVDGGCALLDTGSVKCWGYQPRYFCKGEPSVTCSHTPPRLHCEGGSTVYVLDPTEVDLGPSRTAKHLFQGAYGTCATLDDDTVKCWGTIGWKGAPIGMCMEEVDLNPGFGPGRKVVDLGMGVLYGCALLDDGTVKCWGSNLWGSIGTGAPGSSETPMAVDLGVGLTATALTVSGGHACAVLSDGTTKCWGFNHYGLLGVGDQSNRGDKAGQMGSALPAVDLSD